MDLNKLSDLQAELDIHISLEKQVIHKNHIKEKAIALCVELGELLNERPMIFKYWSTKTGDRDKALTEYVDMLHFLLSYGNAIKFDFSTYKYKAPNVPDQRDLILGLFSMFATLPYIGQFEKVLNHYLLLADKLNFTQAEIETAYLVKNEINYARQNNGY